MRRVLYLFITASFGFAANGYDRASDTKLAVKNTRTVTGNVLLF